MPETITSKLLKYYDDTEDWGPGMRETIRRINAGLRDFFGHDPELSAALTYAFRGGVGWTGSAWAQVAASTVALTDNATNYVERTPAGAVSTNTTGFTASRLPMAIVTTVDGEITTVVDARGGAEQRGAAYTGIISAFILTLLDDANAAAARTTLGLGTAATAATGDFAAAAHTHAQSDVTGLVAALAALLAKAGGTMTGSLILAGDPAVDLEAATKKYVDDTVAGIGGYTDEQAQDAVGAMVDGSTLEYVDATPLLRVKDAGITYAKLQTSGTTQGDILYRGATGWERKALGTSGYRLKSDGTDLVYAAEEMTLPVVFSGGGAVLTTGVKEGDIYFKEACTIIGYALAGDQSGSIVIDAWKDLTANFPPTVADTIWGGSKPTIAATAAPTIVTGLSIAIAAGTWMRFNIDSVTTLTYATLNLLIRKS